MNWALPHTVLLTTVNWQTAEAEKLKEERVAAYTAKKSKSELGLLWSWSSSLPLLGDIAVCAFSAEAAVVAKSSIILDVKPWDDETGVFCRVHGLVGRVHRQVWWWGVWPPCMLICPSLTAADMADVERAVRTIEADGLLWGQGKWMLTAQTALHVLEWQ